MALAAPGTNRGSRPMLEHTEDQLVRITSTGMMIDPRSISLLHAIANAQRYTTNSGHQSSGKVIIETRTGGSYTIPCTDMNQARQLRDTLAAIANKRVSDARKPKVANGIDYGKTKLAGDPGYSDEVKNVFGAFEL